MKQVDLTKYKTAAGAAKALYKRICELSAQMGQKPEIEVKLLTPEEGNERRLGKCWRVMWESGPFEWGVHLSGGSSIFIGEIDGPMRRELGMKATPTPEFNVIGKTAWMMDHHYSFDVGFHD